MAKLNSKKDVIEWYWPDFLQYCMRTRKDVNIQLGRFAVDPTIDNFWKWYITVGPMGVKNDCRHYLKESIEYV